MASRTARRLLNAYVVLMMVFLALPIAIVIPSAFSAGSDLSFPPQGFSVKWFGAILERPELLAAAANSAAIAVVATAVSLVVGTLSAFALHRFRFPGRGALMTLFMAPLVFPAIVLAAAIAMVLAPLGLIRTFEGLVLAHIVVVLPYVVRTVSATLAEVDRAWEEAALTLGATPWIGFRTVTLPLLRPGLVAGATFSLIISFDEFTISLFLVGSGMMTLPIEMYNYAEFSLDPTLAAVSSLLILLTTLAVLAVERTVGLGKQFS
jgi:putative spermidine/putrescine transport system permease protein